MHPELHGDMLNRIIKIVLAAAFIGLGVWQLVEEEIGNGIFLIILSAFPILLIFRHEMILMAFWYLRKQNFDKADKFLNKIKKPDQLIRRQRAYYYYLNGLMLMNKHRKLSKAEQALRKSLKIGLGMKHDAAMAKLQLATIAISKRRKREAKMLIGEVKKMKESSMFKDQIRQVELMMKRI